MLSPSTFRELISGQRRGGLAAIARFGLRLTEFPYTWAVRWRNRRFDLGRLPISHVDVRGIRV